MELALAIPQSLRARAALGALDLHHRLRLRNHQELLVVLGPQEVIHPSRRAALTAGALITRPVLLVPALAVTGATILFLQLPS